MRRAIFAAVVPLVGGALGAATLWAWGPRALDADPPSGDPAASVSAEPSTEPVSPVPPSSDTPSDAPMTSPDPAEDPASLSATASGKETAVVELSYLGWESDSAAVEASGYAAVYEDTGTCTLVLTREGTTQTDTVVAVPDVSTTSCGGLSVDRGRLSGGTWSAVLHYQSPTSAGSSAPREVVVP